MLFMPTKRVPIICSTETKCWEVWPSKVSSFFHLIEAVGRSHKLNNDVLIDAIFKMIHYIMSTIWQRPNIRQTSTTLYGPKYMYTKNMFLWPNWWILALTMAHSLFNHHPLFQLCHLNVYILFIVLWLV